jgi:hypothetical protein
MTDFAKPLSRLADSSIPNTVTPAAGKGLTLDSNGLIPLGISILTTTSANKPAASSVPAGTIIFVSDGGAGAVFQGSTGSAWVNLG